MDCFDVGWRRYQSVDAAVDAVDTVDVVVVVLSSSD